MAKSKEEMVCYLSRKHAITRLQATQLLDTGVNANKLDRLLSMTEEGWDVQLIGKLVALMVAPDIDYVAVFDHETKEKTETLQELQQAIGEWSVEQFGDNANNLSKLDGLPMGSKAALYGIVEEVGELHGTTICTHQGRRGYDDLEKYKADRDDALGDILVFMCDYACREGVDLLTILRDTWHKVVKHRKNTGEAKDWDNITHHTDADGLKTTFTPSGEVVTEGDKCEFEVMGKTEIEEEMKHDAMAVLYEDLEARREAAAPKGYLDPEYTFKRAQDDGVCYESEVETEEIRGCGPSTQEKFYCPYCKGPVSDGAVDCLRKDKYELWPCPECKNALTKGDFENAQGS